eukprot:TRINITY_DN104168_c0_g1_i1.p1 TRINITY_DN104168_c0_g1~~TRINITY_DN104168_c0_g1_i1.p1  ORF type:complete len:280 (-),score=62.52 TRINITY_DN104168_c0_g1_i1:29-868(-)
MGRHLGLHDSSLFHPGVADSVVFLPSCARRWIASEFLGSSSNAGTWPSFHTFAGRVKPRLQTSFEGKAVEASVNAETQPAKSPAARIEEVNKAAADSLARIQSLTTAVPAQRAELDAAMGGELAKLSPWCEDYMSHRALLRGLAAAQCVASQGEVNAMQLEDDGGLAGCVDAFGPPGSPAKLDDPSGPLSTKPCTHSGHELTCTSRLNYLLARQPAPGYDPDGGSPSMDDDVRKWCNPHFTLPGRPLPADLASGMAVNDDAEKEAESMKPAGGDAVEKA